MSISLLSASQLSTTRLWTTILGVLCLSKDVFVTYTADMVEGRPRGVTPRHTTRLNSGVREARERRGLSQEALARAVSVSRNTIVAIERGESVPNVLIALSIASTLGSKVEELFGPLASDVGEAGG